MCILRKCNKSGDFAFMFVHVCLADPLAMEITMDNLDNRLYNLENLFQEV